MSENCDLARRGLEQSLQNFYGRRLPCSVWPKQSKTFAGLNFQIQPAYSLDLSIVSLAQVSTLDGCGQGRILAHQEQNEGQIHPRSPE